jgi:hypothetical protein
MSPSSKIASLRLPGNGPETCSAIAAAAAVSIRSHLTGPRLRILVTGDELPATTIAALISALRKLREVGGTLEVRAENKAPRQIIIEHGLGRVFAFPLPLASVVGRRRRHSPIAETLRRATAALGNVIGQSPGPFREPWWMVW